MKTRSLLRSCFIILFFLHLIIIFSLFYSPSQGGNFWQKIFPSWSNLLQGGLPLVFSILLFGALVFPPLASWIASRLPMKVISLVGLWISLALSLAACLFFSWPFWSLPLSSSNESGAPNAILAVLLLRAPFFGFGLSSILCFMLAICLPLLNPHEQTVPHVRRQDGSASIEEAGRERSAISKDKIRSSRTSQNVCAPLFASFGLLCHLLIVGSLFFPYIDFYDPYGGIVTPTTGWQLLAQAFQPQTAPGAAYMPPLPAPLGLIALTTLILPALIYLVYLALWFVKSELKNTQLQKSVFICYVLSLLGLSLSAFFATLSALSRGGDLHDPVQNTLPAFAIPPIAFLLSLACSYVLVNRYWYPSLSRTLYR